MGWACSCRRLTAVCCFSPRPRRSTDRTTRGCGPSSPDCSWASRGRGRRRRSPVDDQLGRDVVVLQAVIELEGVGQRHALIGGAVLDQRRRLRLLDVGDRRRLRVDLRIVPRRRLEVLPRERRDVGVDVVGHPVGDAGADRDRLEARRVVRREKRRDVAALAPAHGADLRRIDHPLRDQRVDAREHVPRVADAEIADVERAELLAVAGAAAVVRLEDEDAARHPDVDRIDRAGERDGARHAGRTAVNHDEQRVLSSRRRSRPACAARLRSPRRPGSSTTRPRAC